MSERLTVMLAGDMGAPWKPWLEDHLTTDWNILTWAKDEPFERFAELIVAADAIAAGPVRGDWPITAMTAYAIEGNIKAKIPEWDGQWVQIKLEQTALFDGERVIYIAGRQTAWHLVQ